MNISSSASSFPSVSVFHGFHVLCYHPYPPGVNVKLNLEFFRTSCAVPVEIHDSQVYRLVSDRVTSFCGRGQLSEERRVVEQDECAARVTGGRLARDAEAEGVHIRPEKQGGACA